MPTCRTAVTVIAISLAAAFGGPVPVQAQSAYPSKPVRVTVPWPAGGTVDVNGRLLITAMTSQPGWNIVVENRPGANGIIGADGVMKSAPDGYTLLYTSSAIAINQVLYPERKLNVLRDFQPVTNSTSTQGSLVTINASYPVRDLKDFVALARAQAKEGKPLAYGSPGVGNGIHLTTELFAMRTGIQLLHVPHPGIPQILQSIAQGSVALLITQGAALEPLIKQGRLRALAVTGAERISAAPDAPTLAELGVPGFPIPGSWSGFYAPAKTPMDVVMKFQGQVRAALDTPKVKERLAATGNIAVGNTPEQFARLISSEIERYAEVVRVANIKAE